MSPIIFKNRILLTLLVGITLFCSACFFEEEPEVPDAVFNAGEWTTIPPFPYNAWAGVSFGIESTGKGYIGMIAASTFISSDGIRGKLTRPLINELWGYDPGQSRWDSLSSIPGPFRVYPTSFAIENKGYVLSGIPVTIRSSHCDTNGVWFDCIAFVKTPGQDFKELWEFDPTQGEKGKWTMKKEFPGEYRHEASTFVIGNKAYVGLGARPYFEESIQFRDFWEYDPAKNDWREVASLPDEAEVRRSAAAFSIKGKGYIAGGITSGMYKTLGDVWEFDPTQGEKGKWTRKKDLEAPLSTAIGFSIGEKGFVAFGQTATSTEKTSNLLWEYDSVENKWVNRGAILGSSRFNPVAFSVGGKGYLGLGREIYYDTGKGSFALRDQRNFNDFLVYTPYRARPK